MSLKKEDATDPGRASDAELVAAVRRCVAEQAGAFSIIGQIASHFSVTPHRLTAAFRNQLGITPAVYLRQERMRVAQRLLLQTSMPIQDIALALGFSCAANFSSSFRAVAGMSPSEYRRNPQALRDLTTSDVKWGQGPV